MKKTKLVFVEDDVEMAKAYFKRLGLKSMMKLVYLKNLDQIRELLLTHDAKRLYWIDINLGPGKTNDGIEAIKDIRNSDPDALIIVYTAYPEKESDCRKAGANYFFLKNPKAYEADIIKLRELIIVLLELLNQKEGAWKKSTTLYCQIVKIEKERNLVHLNCKNSPHSDETFKKSFSLSHFKDKEKLFIEKSMFVKILERPGEVRFLFKASDETYFSEDEENINDLEDSSLFKKL